jgi:CPA2 family monovalent cation:H+ antiporter-2
VHVIHAARQLAPALPIIVRARDDHDLSSLRAAGATEVVPEVVEGSLMLASHALALAGVPLHRVLRRVREVRDSRYALLRGYFHGSMDDVSERSAEIMLRSYSVAGSSPSVGFTVDSLRFEEIGVEMTSLRRGKERLAIDAGLVIQAHDVMVLRGTSEALAIAEELLSGNRA